MEAAEAKRRGGAARGFGCRQMLERSSGQLSLSASISLSFFLTLRAFPHKLLGSFYMLLLSIAAAAAAAASGSLRVYTSLAQESLSLSLSWTVLGKKRARVEKDPRCAKRCKARISYIPRHTAYQYTHRHIYAVSTLSRYLLYVLQIQVHSSDAYII